MRSARSRHEFQQRSGDKARVFFRLRLQQNQKLDETGDISCNNTMFKDKTFIYWLFCKPIRRQFVVNILVSIGVLITGDFTLSPQKE